ncbi:MAG: hypothetical protein LBF59_10520 [Prevotellaceae bacterium]|nr:hypothetical protein [Prevotellaceae bacterium]
MGKKHHKKSAEIIKNKGLKERSKGVISAVMQILSGNLLQYVKNGFKNQKATKLDILGTKCVGLKKLIYQ